MNESFLPEFFKRKINKIKFFFLFFENSRHIFAVFLFFHVFSFPNFWFYIDWGFCRGGWCFFGSWMLGGYRWKFLTKKLAVSVMRKRNPLPNNPQSPNRKQGKLTNCHRPSKTQNCQTKFQVIFFSKKNLRMESKFSIAVI